MTTADADIHSLALRHRIMVCSARSVLQELGGQWPRGYFFGTMHVISGLLASVASASRSCSCASESRSSDAPVWGCSWRRAAQLAAARMRTVRTVSAWLEALSLRTPRHRHAAIECASWHCDPVERGSREHRMICTRTVHLSPGDRMGI